MVVYITIITHGSLDHNHHMLPKPTDSYHHHKHHQRKRLVSNAALSHQSEISDKNTHKKEEEIKSLLQQ